jgi:hypothetical protein
MANELSLLAQLEQRMLSDARIKGHLKSVIQAALRLKPKPEIRELLEGALKKAREMTNG